MDLFLLCCKHCPNCIQCFSQMEMYKDFLDLSMGNLKDYLSLRGLSTTGRKVELVARAFSAFEMKLSFHSKFPKSNTWPVCKGNSRTDYASTIYQIINPVTLHGWMA